LAAGYAARRDDSSTAPAVESLELEPAKKRSPDGDAPGVLATLLFLCVNFCEMRSLLSVKRATQCLDVTRPLAAGRRGFSRYWLRDEIGFDAISRRHGYNGFAIHR